MQEEVTSPGIKVKVLALLPRPAGLPPPYMTANMMEEIQETLLLDALKMTSISLKNTVMDLGKA